MLACLSTVGAIQCVLRFRAQAKGCRKGLQCQGGCTVLENVPKKVKQQSGFEERGGVENERWPAAAGCLQGHIPPWSQLQGQGGDRTASCDAGCQAGQGGSRRPHVTQAAQAAQPAKPRRSIGAERRRRAAAHPRRRHPAGWPPRHWRCLCCPAPAHASQGAAGSTRAGGGGHRVGLGLHDVAGCPGDNVHAAGTMDTRPPWRRSPRRTLLAARRRQCP